MSYSLDTPSIQTLKAEARSLRDERVKAGGAITHAMALEEVAKTHGYRDWNTAVAMLPERVAVPVQVGDRASGHYLGQPFKGLVIGVQILSDMQHYQVTVKFDNPVDVATSKLFSAFRHRVTATIDVHGVSPAHTSNGVPQMRVRRI
ncbi:glyoxalase superfamily protein [Devosia rhodophyticola]|uniref:Glyoxalase superfamily protein n=1 Tax=Devosia rhodophyticola TaxID=3026423 RepID=A0ABY7YW74_9HYPH|nr:glyoxalase superfamily protein [Devosia rhodophyticola]WDR05615.1 glyoxalase superfamily protein [Devosia rhodophyticola]